MKDNVIQCNSRHTSVARKILDFHYLPAHLNADCWANQRDPNEAQTRPEPFPLQLYCYWADGPTPVESLNLYAVQGIKGTLVVADVPDQCRLDEFPSLFFLFSSSHEERKPYEEVEGHGDI